MGHNYAMSFSLPLNPLEYRLLKSRCEWNKYKGKRNPNLIEAFEGELEREDLYLYCEDWSASDNPKVAHFVAIKHHYHKTTEQFNLKDLTKTLEEVAALFSFLLDKVVYKTKILMNYSDGLNLYSDEEQFTSVMEEEEEEDCRPLTELFG